MESDVQGIIDTNKFNRKSANTHNYYTIWMDNHPSWSDYPKRSKSLICSMSEDYAGSFGDLKLIIPADGNKIGICSDDDLWTSFDHMSEVTSPKSSVKYGMDDLNGIIHHIVTGAFSEHESRMMEKDFMALKSFCTRLTTSQVQYYSTATNLDTYLREEFASLLVAMERAGVQNLYELLEDALDPSKNYFVHQVAGSASFGDGNSEIWVQGECAIIDMFRLKSDNMLQEFMDKHKLDYSDWV